MAVDVSEQVQIRHRIEESELFAKSIINYSPVAKIVFTGDNLIIKTANHRMLEMLGKDVSVIGQALTSVLSGSVLTNLLYHLTEVLRTGDTLYLPEEKVTFCRNGKEYIGYFNYIFNALPDTSGRIYGVILTATEVTEQVLNRQKIQEAEETLRGAIELAELGTWNLDLKSRRIKMSARLELWFGVPHKEHHEDVEVIQAIAPTHREQVVASVKKASLELSENAFDTEFTVSDLSGNQRIVHAQGKVFFDENGIASRLSGTAQDVTKQRKIQLSLEQEVRFRTEQLQTVNRTLLATNEELAQANEQLIRSNEELAQYAYVASHDLQEPLRKIRVFTDLLGRQESHAAWQLPYLQRISQSAERMSLLIQDLLSFSRLLNAESLYQEVNLNLLVKQVCDDFELLIEEKQASIDIAPLSTIDAIPLQMNQLFYNLFSNALKFTKPQTRPHIHITQQILSAEEAALVIPKPMPGIRYIQILFSDNGIGFDAAYAEQVFVVFKRLHERNVFPGSGIGLALCRRITTNHKGYIRAESSVGQGTTFKLLLPERQPHSCSNC